MKTVTFGHGMSGEDSQAMAENMCLWTGKINIEYDAHPVDQVHTVERNSRTAT